MKIIMGADPAGFELKNAIKADLLKKGYDIIDIDPETPVLFQEAAVAVAGEQCKESGAKRVVPLKVSGPFHSPMLKEAGEKLGEALAAVTLREIKLPYLANVTADYVREAETVKLLLKQQVCAPVCWQQSMERLLADGVDTFVEIGPGHTLSGFMKKILKQAEVPADTVQVYNVETMDDFKEYMSK